LEKVHDIVNSQNMTSLRKSEELTLEPPMVPFSSANYLNFFLFCII